MINIIEIRNLSKKFNKPFPKGTIIFNDLNICIEKGEIVCIVGPNGCGKTTLFNIITGIEKYDKGNIKFNNDKNIGYMPQKDLLLPWRTVYGNIIIGLEIQGKLTNETEKKVDKYLIDLGLINNKKSYPNTLSGGERQKVALIRTLVNEAEVYLLDEPFSSIDYETRLLMEKLLYSLIKTNNKTVLLVTHNIDEAIAMGDRVIVFGPKPLGNVSTIKIDLNITDRDPITARQNADFAKYFKNIWEEYLKW